MLSTDGMWHHMVHPDIKKGNLLAKEAPLTRKAVTKHRQHHRTRTDSCREEIVRLLTPACGGLKHEEPSVAFPERCCARASVSGVGPSTAAAVYKLAQSRKRARPRSASIMSRWCNGVLQRRLAWSQAATSLWPR